MHVNLPKKRYYRIGEVAKALSVNASLLRFWEKEFKEIQPRKKEGKARKYTLDDVVTIQKIYHLLKERGLTIEGAKKQLKLKIHSAYNCCKFLTSRNKNLLTLLGPFQYFFP